MEITNLTPETTQMQAHDIPVAEEVRQVRTSAVVVDTSRMEELLLEQKQKEQAQYYKDLLANEKRKQDAFYSEKLNLAKKEHENKLKIENDLAEQKKEFAKARLAAENPAAEKMRRTTIEFDTRMEEFRKTEENKRKVDAKLRLHDTNMEIRQKTWRMYGSVCIGLGCGLIFVSFL